MKTLLFLSVFIVTHLYAIPEKNYREEWYKKVKPYFQDMSSQTFTNAQGMTLHYHYLLRPGAKKTLIILPGRTEPSIKYAELIYDLKTAWVNIFVLDHQGQGESTRLLKDSHKGHVLNFKNYAQDLHQWIESEVKPKVKNQEFLLMSHSMGAAMGTIYLAEHPGTFSRALLSSPMFEMNTKPYPELIARGFSTLLVKTGKGEGYAPDRGPYVPEEDSFEENEVTFSPDRHDVIKATFLDDPHLVVGGPTARWVYESLKATANIDELASKITIPLLVFQSGKDKIVKPGRQIKFCKKAPSCFLMPFPEAQHEIFSEKDFTRTQAYGALRLFLKI